MCLLVSMVRRIYSTCSFISCCNCMCQFKPLPVNANFEDFTPIDIADMIKMYYRQLPEPVITARLSELLIVIQQSEYSTLSLSLSLSHPSLSLFLSLVMIIQCNMICCYVSVGGSIVTTTQWCIPYKEVRLMVRVLRCCFQHVASCKQIPSPKSWAHIRGV